MLYLINCKTVGKDPSTTCTARHPPASDRGTTRAPAATNCEVRNNRGGERGNRNGRGFDLTDDYNRQRSSDSYKGGDVRQHGNYNRSNDSSIGGMANMRNDSGHNQQHGREFPSGRFPAVAEAITHIREALQHGH